MTLSLTLATPRYVLQATDRLVSDTKTGNAFDLVSNKNVVYHARDAILAIAYSGTAYVRDRPTDQWIAELLAGEKFFEDGMRWSHRMGRRSEWLDAGTCVARLRESIKKARVASRSTPFSVVVAGWQWKKERLRARPVLSGLTYDGKTMHEVNVDRYWHLAQWSPSPQPIYPCTTHIFLAPHCLIGIPDGNITDEFITRIARRLQGRLNSPVAAFETLVESLRERSREVPGIGKDCLGIYLSSSCQSSR